MLFPRPSHAALALSLMAVFACAPGDGRDGQNATAVEGLVAAPPGAPEGTCWARYVTPAVIETVTEHVLARPAELASDGTVSRPPSYSTETRQEIVTPRRETLFETLCPYQLTPEFIASVQRALAARGLMQGPASGEMDGKTRAAIRAYQADGGPDSGILAIDSARRLGLVAAERPVTE